MLVEFHGINCDILFSVIALHSQQIHVKLRFCVPKSPGKCVFLGISYANLVNVKIYMDQSSSGYKLLNEFHKISVTIGHLQVKLDSHFLGL